MNFRPTVGRLIVRKDDTPEKIGHIYIPKNSRELESSLGEVVAVSTNTEFEVGMRVMYGKYAGYNFESSDRGTYLYLNEEDVLGIEQASPAN